MPPLEMKLIYNTHRLLARASPMASPNRKRGKKHDIEDEMFGERYSVGQQVLPEVQLLYC